LIKPTSGTVSYGGKPLIEPAEGIAVVFQKFALFPWLTVLENVEAGLYALGLFQSAYPRELSGGMRQRVGFARAIVTQHQVLAAERKQDLKRRKPHGDVMLSFSPVMIRAECFLPSHPRPRGMAVQR
jgi:ABC-type nitrate/sulfonate/bicarbonate transport system ATPase subunit